MRNGEQITVTLNGQRHVLAPGQTVTGLLEGLDLNPALVVVEKNREILDRALYSEATVEHGDVLELVHFVGGG